MKATSPLKAIRLYCLECAGNSSRYVRYCPCDGVHSTACNLWPLRFGKMPETARKHGLPIDPESMPSANTPLEACTDTPLAFDSSEKTPSQSLVSQKFSAGRPKHRAEQGNQFKRVVDAEKSQLLSTSTGKEG